MDLIEVSFGQGRILGWLKKIKNMNVCEAEKWENVFSRNSTSSVQVHPGGIVGKPNHWPSNATSKCLSCFSSKEPDLGSGVNVLL